MTASAPIYKSHKKMKLLKSRKRSDALRRFHVMNSFDPVTVTHVRIPGVKIFVISQNFGWLRYCSLQLVLRSISVGELRKG